MFLRLADGVDDATWLHHLRAGDYSKWLREKIKDAELAQEVEGIEASSKADPKESRAAISQAVAKRYTSPAETS
jgi:hypothetical protein